MSYEKPETQEEYEVRFSNDIKKVMATLEGRRLIAAIMDSTGYRKNPVDKEPHVTLAKVGAANVGRYIETLLFQHAPDMYTRMIKEFNYD